MEKQQIKAALEILLAVSDAIKEAGPEGLPEGHLYAMLASHFSLSDFECLINKLMGTGLFRRENHVISYSGEVSCMT